MGVKRFFEYSTSLTLHRGSEFWFCFVRNCWKMATGRQWRSWWKWSKFDFCQMSQHPTPQDSVQSHSENPQAPHRHLTDTSQTPYRHPTDTPTFWPIRDNWEKWNKLIKMSLIGWLLIACTIHPPRHYPESLGQPPDNSQTPYRHPTDTLQTFRGTWERRN